jgi:8-oxo-dGTP pyrophosphatase MutT (NUDIX family)
MVFARFASTVVLVRPTTGGGFEILLTRRPAEMRFLGGFYVFPGGTVHADDYSAKVLERCRGLSADEARRILGNRHEPEPALGHWVAVFRELFEEVGVLLCTTSSGDDIDLNGKATKERIELRRQAIVKKELDFGAFLDAEDFYCYLSRAVYFDHWVTPEVYSMRFDTRFYLAPLPANQIPLRSSEEVTDSVWIRPDEALARTYDREFPLIPPTTTVLGNLARLGSWDRLRGKYFLP